MNPETPPTLHRDDGPFSTTAIISYLLIGNFTFCMIGVFAVIFFKVAVESVMLGVLGSLITAVVGGLTGVGGFWLASSIGSRRDGAAMRQLAGAGPPPPADPTAPATIEPEIKR